MCAALLGWPSTARAELPGGAKITFNRVFIHKDNASALTPVSTDQERNSYFNAAHCVCSKAKASEPTFYAKDFVWELVLETATVPINRPGELWVGTDCSNDTTRPTTCARLSATIPEISDLPNNPKTPPLSIYNLMRPLGGDCEARTLDAAVWVGVDSANDGTNDSWTTEKIVTDAEPPPLPGKITASTGESAILVTWTAPTTRTSDTEYYQFLCATADGKPALSAPSHDPKYETAKTLCGVDSPISFVPVGDTNATVPAWLKDADASYLCGQAGKTATSARLSGLRNGQPVQVALVAVDLAGNATGAFLTEQVTPKAVTDFWEELHNQGSQAEGGYCLLARTYGEDSDLSQALRSFRDETLADSAAGRWMIARYYGVSAKLAPLVGGWATRLVAAALLAPLVALALLWHGLTLPGCALAFAAWMIWRRHRRSGALARRAPARGRTRAIALGVAALGLAGWARTSAAQSFSPYWDDDTAATSESPEGEVRWHAGIRVGPYSPAIDEHFASSPGPYEQMFGGDTALPMLDVDFIIWDGFGQLGIGGSAGFMNKKARTYADGSEPGADRMRAAEENRFRLVPLAATAVYRLTYLDDAFHVPIVPYLRGGLAYYLWWVEGPDGGVASVCRGAEPGQPDPTTCDENKARGGSLGVVGSVGLAIRAERIDFEAASAMREGGIQHAGFYAELQAGKVDDFGYGHKLSVGDLTWFAGVDFEF